MRKVLIENNAFEDALHTSKGLVLVVTYISEWKESDLD